MKICKQFIFIFLLLFTNTFLHAQSIKRSAISFYGITSPNLKATAGQLVAGSSQNAQNSFVIGFQQPLANKINATFNLKVDTILCANATLVLKAGNCFKYQWFRNDTLIANQNADSLIVAKEGTYKLVGYDGIAKFDTSKVVKVSYLLTPPKPFIQALQKDTTLCFYDTVRLTASAGYDKYRWSTGDSVQSILTSYAGNIIVYGAKRIGLTSTYCYSDSSNMITTVKNRTPIPSIIRISDDLVSSQSLLYKWYMNNLLQPNFTTSVLRIPSKGFFRVETSIDKICWSKSKDYIVQTAPVSTTLKDFSLSVYPNPTLALFYLQIKLDQRYSGFAQIAIVDITGVTKWNFNQFIFNESNIKIPINLNLNKGTYTIQVKVNGYKTKAIQIIGL